LISGIVKKRSTDTVSESVDHSMEKYYPPIANQGSEGSCNGFASAYYVHTYYMARNNERDLSSCMWEFSTSPGYPSTEYQKYIMSPEFLYHMVNGGFDNGSSLVDAVTLLNTIGISSWDKMPYDDNDHTTWPSQAAFQEAPLYRASGDILDTNLQAAYVWSENDANIATAIQLLNAGFLLTTAVDAEEFIYLNDHDVWTNESVNKIDTVSNGWLVNHAQNVVGYKLVFDPENP